MKALDKGGKLIINAIRKIDLVGQLDYTEHLWHEKQIQSVANVTRKDAEEFLPLAADIGIKPKVEDFELDQANQALILLKQSRIKAAAALKIS